MPKPEPQAWPRCGAHAGSSASGPDAARRRWTDLFRRLRTLPPPVNATPVIMLTAKGDPMDRVVGLEIGAEDYISKPFEPRELLARIRVVLRRGAEVPRGRWMSSGSAGSRSTVARVRCVFQARSAR